PDYTGLVPKSFDVRGTMEVPKGSLVTVVGHSNKPLRQASVEITYGDANAQRPKLKSDVKLDAPGSHDFSFVIEDVQGKNRVQQLLDTQDLHFTLEDEDGIRTRQPVPLSITAVEDQVPHVEVRLSDVGDAVTPQVRIPFEGKITDQYGVVKAF